MFPDAYNPFALADVPGDWGWLDTKKVDMGPYFRRRGLVFVDGKPLEPVEQSRELGNTRLQPAPRPVIPATTEPRHPRPATACRRARAGAAHAGNRRLAGWPVLGGKPGKRH